MSGSGSTFHFQSNRRRGSAESEEVGRPIPIAGDGGVGALSERLAALNEQMVTLQESLAGLVAGQVAALKEQAEHRAEVATLQADVARLAEALDRLAENVEELGRGSLPVLITTAAPLPQEPRATEPPDQPEVTDTGITLQPVRPRLQLGESDASQGEKVLKLDS